MSTDRRGENEPGPYRHPGRREFLLAAAAAGFAGPACSETEGIEQDELQAVRATALAFISSYAIPGLSVAMCMGRKLVYAEGFGFADREKQEPMTPRSLLRIASVSKPVTSAAIFMLVEKRLLSMDSRVFGPGGLLAAEFGAGPFQPFACDITVEHLLTHTCGGWSNTVGDPMFFDRRLTQAQLISWALANLPLNKPGLYYSYSNLGYCVLGRIIEKLTGRSYESHILASILGPAGAGEMRISGNTYADRLPGEVTYYGYNGENPYGMNVRRMDSHGGWLASAAHLVRFASHLSGDGGFPSLITPESMTVMLTGSAAAPWYGKGWALTGRGSRNHSGSLPGTSSYLSQNDGGLSAAAICNTRRKDAKIEEALGFLLSEMASKISRWPENDITGFKD